MTAVKQHRRLTVRGRQLQPPRCRLVGGFYLSDNAGQRAIAQGILRHGEHRALARALRIEDLVRTKSHLFEARRVKVEPGECPKGGKVRLAGEARGYAGDEQRRCRIIAERRASRGDLVQRRAIQPAIGKAIIKRGDAKRQGWATRATRLCQLSQ
jgi:hypothetical protein